jgi:hypothetical protein
MKESDGRSGAPCELRTTNHKGDYVIAIECFETARKEKFMEYRVRYGLAALLMLVLLFAAIPAPAQMGSAALTGKVADSSGLVVAGVSVTATNVATDVGYPATTNDDGIYSLPALAPGTYRITVEKQGFQRIVKPDVVLHVADNISIDFAIQVGTVAQTVTVEGGAPLVDTTTSTLGGLVQSNEVENLPLNERNYIDLTLMQPGVAPAYIEPGGAYNGTWFVVNGATERSNNFLLDGAIMQDEMGGSTATFSGRTLGLDGIQEYRVITNNPPAEYGLLMGSQTVMASRAGTNEWHGSAFEYLRNSALDAKNYFDHGVAANDFQRLPPYRLNDFGASGGGPIRKDKTFVFLTYEQVKEGLGVTTVDTVPAATCHGAAGAVITSAACPQLGSTAAVTISPVIAPLLAIYPNPNLPDNKFTTPYSQPDRDIYGQARVDQVFSPSDRMFGRYTIDDDAQVVALTFPELFTNPRLSRQQYATLSEDHIFSSSLLNDFRFSYSRTAAGRTNTDPFPQYSFVPGEPMGTISVGGLSGTMGPPQGPLQVMDENLLTGSDDVSYTVGHHSIKFGTDINRFRQFGLNSKDLFGAVTFGSLATFLAGDASLIQAVTPGSDVTRTYQFYTLGFYVQDDWRLRSNFTLNLGLRYEPSADYYNEVFGKSVALINPQTDAANTIAPMFRNPTLHNFSPRLGFAWDVFGNGKTSVRGGANLLYDLTSVYLGLYNDIPDEPPFSTTSSGSGVLTLPITPSTVTAADSVADYNLKQARLFTESLTVEQQLPFTAVLSVSYVGSRGEHLGSTEELDPHIPAGFADGLPFWNPSAITKTNPAWSTVQAFGSNGSSVYNALEVVVTKRMTHGLQFQSSYTWEKLIDNQTGYATSDCGTTTTFPADPFQSLGGVNGRYDRGPSCYNIPQVWVTNYIYKLPSPHMQDGVLGTLTSGWQLMGIYTLRSGLPFNPCDQTERSDSNVAGGGACIDRPDYNPAFSGPIITGNPNQWFNPAAYMLQPAGTLGNVGRNSLYGPGFDEFDFAIQKDTKLGFLGEAGNLAFRAEFFNVANHANFGIPSATTFAGTLTAPVTEAPLSTAGQITSTAGTSRQIEFSLRLSF